MSVHTEGRRIYLYGDVGDFGNVECFSPSDVLVALRDVGSTADIVVSINSGGGYAFDGLAIYNSLTAHRGSVDVEVDGVAASAASLIAMAGRKIVMRAGSMMMIHDPSGISIGPSDVHGRNSEVLDRQADQMATVYAKRSGKSLAAVRAMMRAETWFTDREAVAAGFATSVEAIPSKLAASFNYRVYAHAPRQVLDARPLRISLAALMRKRCGLQTDEEKAAEEANLSPLARNMVAILAKQGKR